MKQLRLEFADFKPCVLIHGPWPQSPTKYLKRALFLSGFGEYTYDSGYLPGFSGKGLDSEIFQMRLEWNRGERVDYLDGTGKSGILILYEENREL